MKSLVQSDMVAGGRTLLDFEDNRLLAPLYGEHDRNLAQIELAFGVTIHNRGNHVAIEGAESARTQARAVLLDLYRRLENGETVGSGDVFGSIRMAKSGAMQTDDAQGDTPMPGDRRLEIATRNRIIKPRSSMQAAYVRAMQGADLIFGIGPAGTGKTYLAVAMAVARMLKGEHDRIILSRPAVEAGENLGFLPGDLREKVDPYLRPLYDALYDMLPADQVEKRLLSGQIEVAPLAYMRGRTLSDAYVILDEAQNTTAMQMKMFLTRFGENARMVICGDPSQVDLPAGARSGLAHALDVLAGIEGVAVIRFSEEDVVRHPLVADIVAAYDRHDRGESGTGEQ